MPLNILKLAGVLSPDSTAELQTLRQRLRRAHTAIRDLRGRIAQHKETIDRLKQTRDEMKQHVLEVQTHANARRHTELSREVLDQLFGMRLRQRPVLSSDISAAEARERRFLEASSEYRAAVEDDASRVARLERVEMCGVPWWLPKDERVAGRTERLRRDAFPLRAVLQTREVSLGGVMLDLGANVGRTSIPRLVLGDVRAVYAAEPEPINHACLVQNVVEHGLRGYVMPDRVAIGATRGEVQLKRSPYIGGHRVLYGGPQRERRAETTTVPLWPVDEWMARIGVGPEEVGFVKVDTQGSEVNVLRGAPALLARSHVAWQMEVDAELLGHAGTSVSELLGLLETHFTHFIDLCTSVTGPRARPTRDLRESLAYVGVGQHKTDLVLYNAAP